MSQNLELTQTQRLRLTRQQLQFVRLLELNAPEMDEAVERELEENPALEPEYAAEPEKTTAAESRDTTPWYLRSANNGTPDTDYDIIGADTDVSLFDYLERQLDERTLSLRIRAGAVYIARPGRHRRRVAPRMPPSATSTPPRIRRAQRRHKHRKRLV